jgi:DNA-binding transcriptional MerR regulator
MSSALVKNATTDELEPFVRDNAKDRYLLSTRDMVERFKTSSRTLRLYESRGLLHPTRKGASRCYDLQAQRRFRQIDEGRRLGLAFDELAELLGNASTGIAISQIIREIRQQIAKLEREKSQIERTLCGLRQRYYIVTSPDLEDIE